MQQRRLQPKALENIPKALENIPKNMFQNFIYKGLDNKSVIALHKASKKWKNDTTEEVKLRKNVYKKASNIYKQAIHTNTSQNNSILERKEQIASALHQLTPENINHAIEHFNAMRKPPFSIKGNLYKLEKLHMKHLPFDFDDLDVIDDIQHLAFVIKCGAFASLTHLKLSRLPELQLDHHKMNAFANAISNGALASLTVLQLQKNHIEDEGMESFATACAMGALPALMELYLYKNNIANAGMIALADAVSNGVLDNLEILDLSTNVIGDDGMIHFAKAITPDENGDVILGKLEVIFLRQNSIKDNGMRAFSHALEKGGLPSNYHIEVDNNPFVLSSVVDSNDDL